MTNDDAQDARKSALRGAARARRRELARSSPDAGGAAALAFAASPQVARVAAIYHPQGSEFDPWPLAAVLRTRGIAPALPVVVGPDQPLVFRLMGEGDLLRADAAGLPAPHLRAPQVAPELVFAPLLAFDARGGRLGQGGGYYDRTLCLLRARGHVVVLGLAYAGQEIDAVPTEAHDQRLDGVLTEAGLRFFDQD